MLRSLYSGISGLRSHQTMLDVTGNNIANVNTTGFKGSATQFQDTLSQLVQGAGRPAANVGGTNPAQVGLGVQVAGITTNFSQGSAQMTGRSTDMMIAGDGFFVVRQGTETLYTRSGAFDFDARGRLVTADGAFVQGWAAAGGTVSAGGPAGPITLPLGAIAPAVATTTASLGGNLPSDATVGDQLVREVEVFDAAGNGRMLSFTFTKSAAGWDVSGDDGSGAVTASLTFTDGVLDAAPAMTIGGVAVDFGAVTGYAGLTTATVTGQDGRNAGTLESFSLAKDGSIVGAFSNGATEVLAQLALANFVNPVGLEKAGASSYRATLNSGAAALGTAGSEGLGLVLGSALEMSNVDLSQEFTNLIVAQRGFQANARIITTSDEVLQELTNLKR
ncbi:flagellar hook protein FlgE [Ruicaihuangia caeni]|uniref:Flagellar hook protein FlgE n=1 Tax=Ruicaihuangia caeni TaxID=3042517 RepID=A0AAW6T709_9MICO|nr:flagellar hook protein FlgE [Klugiella sp. YN-L-19]MDI2097885.1 flagellar hook protein FlgE [Klugiella sp. YN-L-19]